MNRSTVLVTLIGVAALSACDRPTVVNVPPPAPSTVVVPGPPGAQGAPGLTGSTGSTGAQGTQGNTGNTGRTGGSTTVIVVPPASAPAPAN